jgi:predicted HTH domain antitoxin
MCELMITVPDSHLSALNVSREHAANEVRMLAAVKLFELGRLSSGAAAEFAGIPKPLFIERLRDYGVASFRQTEGELEEELRNA